MSTTTQTPRAAVAPSSLAQSATFRTFATVFAIVTPIIYVVCEMRNWPLFTYHPGTNRLDLGWAAAVRDEGPAMHWYGWTLTMLIAGGVIAAFATLLPQRVASRIPLWLTWVVPLTMVPILIYALRFFWRW